MIKRITNYLFACLVIAGLISCGNRNHNIPGDVVNNPNTASGKEVNDLPVIQFDQDLHDFGKVIQGEMVTFGFRFKNTGKSDLLISQVNTSCGCTVTQYPKEPIEPGKGGVIKVTFDSSGRKGIQNKSITVVSNCQPNTSVVRIKAMVIVP